LNIVRTVFLALGAIFALVLISVGIFSYLITGPAPTYQGHPVQVSDEAAASLDSKIEAFRQAIDQASPGDVVTLLVTQEEATSKLNQLAEDGELPLEMKHVQIHFSDGTVHASAMVDLLIDIQVAAQAKLRVDEEGRPIITIQMLNFGRLGTPRTLVDNVMLAVMKKMEQRLDALPFQLQDIIMGNGEITITGRVK